MSTGVTGGDAFEKALYDFIDVTKANIGIVLKYTSKDLYFRIVRRTPVDTGRAKSSWERTVGQPSTYVPPKEGFPPIGDQDALEVDGTQNVYIVSNLNYVEYLENGSSQQAPNGMVAISVLEVQQELEAITRAYLKKQR